MRTDPRPTKAQFNAMTDTHKRALVKANKGEAVPAETPVSNGKRDKKKPPSVPADNGEAQGN